MSFANRERNMTEEILNKIARLTKELVAKNLRGKAVIIAHLYPHILAANRTGYIHKTIHETIVAAGLDITHDAYRLAVHRAKLKIAKGDFVIESVPIQTPSPTPKFIDDDNFTQVTSELENAHTSTAAQLVDTLKASVNVGSKDYTKAAMQKLNSQRKNK